MCEVVNCEVRWEVGCDWSVASGSPRTLPNGKAALFYSPVDSPMHETCIRVMHV